MYNRLKLNTVTSPSYDCFQSAHFLMSSVFSRKLADVSFYYHYYGNNSYEPTTAFEKAKDNLVYTLSYVVTPFYYLLSACFLIMKAISHYCIGAWLLMNEKMTTQSALSEYEYNKHAFDERSVFSSFCPIDQRNDFFDYSPTLYSSLNRSRDPLPFLPPRPAKPLVSLKTFIKDLAGRTDIIQSYRDTADIKVWCSSQLIRYLRDSTGSGFFLNRDYLLSNTQKVEFSEITIAIFGGDYRGPILTDILDELNDCAAVFAISARSQPGLRY